MALRWNIENCKDFEGLTTDEEWAITDALIWATMSIGINEITKKNLKKVFTRIRIDENLSGSYLTRGKKRYFIKIEDVEKRVGMHTNATRYTDTQFLKRYYK